MSKNIFANILERIRAANDALIAEGLLPVDIDQSRIVVEPPRDPAHGDMATNAAMVLAKDARRSPLELANAIAVKLRGSRLVAKVDVAGTGFINITLKSSAWFAALRNSIKAGPDYGRSKLGRGRRVNVEYVSANPTGPMHVGHCRGAVFGDALANLLAFVGFKVTREYYINDAGAQVDVLARSTYLRYREALGEDIGLIPEGFYPGQYLIPLGEVLAAAYGEALKELPEAEWLPIVREKAVEMMMDEIRRDLAALKIYPDVFFPERSLIASGRSRDKVASAIRSLRARGFVYEGRLPPPKGRQVEDWEDREQTLFRSTAFGDDIDRPLKKSDGSYTYFASDIAYHKSKVDRGFRTMIDVWGADHGGYVKRMQAAVQALGRGRANLDVKIVQLVRLFRDGQPVKMSKRTGEFVTLREVVDEVKPDAVRFMMLFRKNDAVLDFDLAKVIEQTRDNPVFYVQYGHARAQSVFRNARDVIPSLPQEPSARAVWLAGAPLKKLSGADELSLIRKIMLYPRILEAAAQTHEPHRIAFYLYDVASEFHALYTRGTELPSLRFIIPDDPQTTAARLALVQGVVTVLASGLELLGVEALNEMR